MTSTTCNIALYVFDIRDFPDMDEINDSNQSLSRFATDRERVLQYHFRPDRCRCLAGQLLIKKFVGDSIIRSDLQAGLTTIKPVRSLGPMFNISHDDNYVILATCDGFSIGVDLMRIKASSSSVTVHDMLINLRNIFTDNEWGYIQGSDSDSVQLERFYRLWTSKEAYVKCLGTGLYTEPSDISLHGFCHPGGEQDVRITHLHHEEQSQMFHIRVSTEVLPGHVMATCAGPVAACDPSWTKFLELPSQPLTMKIENVHIHPLIQVRLSQLV
jgi:phosphopantetheine--protein transferase-like protein